MKVGYNDLAPASKIWIYTADRFLLEEEVRAIKSRLDDFLQQWHSHGSPILNFGDIYHHKFLILFADESHSHTGGCSIDSSVRFVNSLGEWIGVDFFARLEIQYLENNDIKILPDTKSLRAALEDGRVGPETIIFDHTIKNKEEFESGWKKPLKDSWLKRFIPQSNIVKL